MCLSHGTKKFRRTLGPSRPKIRPIATRPFYRHPYSRWIPLFSRHHLLPFPLVTCHRPQKARKNASAPRLVTRCRPSSDGTARLPQLVALLMAHGRWSREARLVCSLSPRRSKHADTPVQQNRRCGRGRHRITIGHPRLQLVVAPLVAQFAARRCTTG